jgi:hypothetical protein
MKLRDHMISVACTKWWPPLVKYFGRMRMHKTVLIAGHCYFWSRSHDYCDRRSIPSRIGAHQRAEI